MFHCLWIRAPRDLPLQTRLYQRTYGRTYGRRPNDADQPVSLPNDLRLAETVKPIAADAVEPAIGPLIDRNAA